MAYSKAYQEWSRMSGGDYVSDNGKKIHRIKENPNGQNKNADYMSMMKLDPAKGSSAYQEWASKTKSKDLKTPRFVLHESVERVSDPLYKPRYQREALENLARQTVDDRVRQQRTAFQSKAAQVQGLRDAINRNNYDYISRLKQQQADLQARRVKQEQNRTENRKDSFVQVPKTEEPFGKKNTEVDPRTKYRQRPSQPRHQYTQEEGQKLIAEYRRTHPEGESTQNIGGTNAVEVMQLRQNAMQYLADQEEERRKQEGRIRRQSGREGNITDETIKDINPEDVGKKTVLDRARDYLRYDPSGSATANFGDVLYPSLRSTGNPMNEDLDKKFGIDRMSSQNLTKFAAAGSLAENNPLMAAEQASKGSPIQSDRARVYTMMTPEEKRNYNAILALNGLSKAEEYHDALLDDINARIARDIYEGGTKEAGTASKALYTLASGLGQGIRGLGEVGNVALGTSNTKATPVSQNLASEIRKDEDNSKIQNVVYDLAQSTGNMLPGIVASAFLGPQAGSAVFAFSQAGNSYREAINAGESTSTATMYSLQQGIDEMTTNFLLGGIQAFGGGAIKRVIQDIGGDAFTKALDRVCRTPAGKQILNRVIDYMSDMGSEAAQEYVQFYTENWTQALLGMKDQEGNPVVANLNPLDPNALYSALLGALNAGALNVPQIAGRTAMASRMDVSDAQQVADFINKDLDISAFNEEDLDKAIRLADISQDIQAKQEQGIKPSLIDKAAYASATEDLLSSDSVRETRENNWKEMEKQDIENLSGAFFGENGKQAFESEIAPENRIGAYRTFVAYYNHGYSGAKIPTEIERNAHDVMSTDQISAALRAGALDHQANFPNAELKTVEDSVSNIKIEGTKEGRIDKSRLNENLLTSQQRFRVRYASALISKTLGIDVEFFQSVVGMDGKFYDPDKVKEGVWKEARNGAFYVSAEGRPTIRLDVNAGMLRNSDWTGELGDIKTMLPIISHELTHYLEKFAPQMYEELSNMVINNLIANKSYGAGLDFNTIVERQRRKMEEDEQREITNDYVLREMVARACEDMLSGNEDAVKAFEKMNNKTKRYIWNHIKKVFKNIEEFFRQMLGTYRSGSAEAQIIRQNMEEFEKIRAKWQEALGFATSEGRNVQFTSPINAETETGSVKDFVNGVSKDGVTLSGEIRAQASERTYEHGGRDFLKMWLTTQSGLSDEDQQDVVEQIDRVYNLMQDIKKEGGLDGYTAWSNVENRNGQLTVVVPNGEYPLNIDFSTVCKKRKALDHILNVMIRQENLNAADLAGKDIVRLQNIIKSEGLEIACALCFVDSKRYRIGDWADRITAGRDTGDGHQYGFNELLDSLIPDGSKLKIDEHNFTGRKISQPKGKLLKNAADSQLDFELVDRLINNSSKSSWNYKVAKAIREHPEIRSYLNSAELLSSIGFDPIRVQSPALYDLINNAGGSSKPKLSFSEVPYLNDILMNQQMKPEQAYKVGGVRIQSFSDFMANMVFDYVQMVGELQAKQLPAHAYTKESSFVALFGMTGIKINMSLVPKATTMSRQELNNYLKQFKTSKEKSKAFKQLQKRAGLDENGNYIWEDETFPYEVAMHFQSDPKYAKNCGTIAVGISDAHIRKLLADPTIQMVIPYHKSGINQTVAKLRGIDLYIDYTNQQNTRYKSTGKKISNKDNTFDFYAVLKETEDPKATADAYLKWCDDNNFIPKFAKFAKGPGSENYYKLLTDFRLYDENGNYAPQEAVKAVYPEDSLMKKYILEGYTYTTEDGKEYHNGGLRAAEATSGLLDERTERIIQRYNAGETGNEAKEEKMQYSSRDSGENMLSEAQEEYFKDSQVRDAEGNLIPVYHGTNAEFNEFSKDFIGSHGSFEGAGFNFTPSRTRAGGYKNIGENAGRVMEGYLNITKPLSDSKKTMSARNLANLIRSIDPTGDNIISNYARDTRDYGKQSFITRESLTTARAIFDFADSDVDIYSELSAAGADPKTIIDAFEKLGYDGLIHHADNGEIKTLIAFESNQFKNRDNVNPTENADIRYSSRDTNTTENTRRIREKMPSEERAEILRHKTISVPRITSRRVDDATNREIAANANKLTDLKKTMKRVAEDFGIIGKQYFNEDAQYSLELSKRKIEESVQKQNKEKYADFALMLSCFKDIAENAIEIEVHNKNDEGYKEDITLKEMRVLVSAFEEGDRIIPVKIELKEFIDKPTSVHVILALSDIKKSDIKRQQVVNDDVAGYPPSLFSKYSVPQILSAINSEDKDFVKYIPDEFRNVAEDNVQNSSREDDAFSLWQDVVSEKNDAAGRDSVFFLDEDDPTKVTYQQQEYFEEMSKTNDTIKAMNAALHQAIGEGKKVDVDKFAEEQAKKLRRSYGSKTAKGDLTEAIRSLCEKMNAAIQKDANDIAVVASNIGREVMQGIIVDDDTMRKQYPNLKRELKTYRILPGEKVRADMAAAYDSYEAFRRRAFGNLTIVGDDAGNFVRIDSVYQELNEKYPELFPDDIQNESEQMLRIMEVAQEVSGKKVTYTEAWGTSQDNLDEMSYMIGQDILNDYYTAAGTPAFGGVLESVRNDLIKQHKAEMKEAFAEKNRTIRDLRERLRNAEGKDSEKIKVRLEALRNDKNNQLARMQQRYEQKMEKIRERRIDADARTRLLKAAQRLARMKGGPDFEARKEALVGDLDLFAKGIGKNTQEKLEQLKTEADQLAAQDENYRLIGYEKARRAFERLSKKRIADMTGPEVAELTERIVELTYMQQATKRILDKELQIQVATAGKRVIAQQKLAKGINDRNVIGSTFGRYALNMLNPTRAMARLDGYQRDGVLTKLGKALNDGQTRQNDFTMRASKKFNTFLDAHPDLVRTWYQTDIDTGFKGEDGKPIYINKGMRISLYLHSLNYQNRNHIARAGIEIPDAKLYQKGKYAEAYRYQERLKLQPTDIKRITDGMTADEKAFANLAHEFLNIDTKDAINETSMVLNGTYKATVDNYFPIRTDPNFVMGDITGLIQDGTIEGWGALKERKEGAAKPVLLEDVAVVLQRQTTNTAKYYGLAIPVRDFNKVIKWQETTGGTSVGEAINKTWGKTGTDYIRNVLRDIQTGAPGAEGPGAKLFSSLKSTYAGTVLNWNIGVSIKQSASAPFAAVVLDTKSIAKAFAPNNFFRKADLEYMDSITPWSYMRRQGMSGTEMGEVYKPKNFVQKSEKLQKFKQKTNFIQAVDVWTTNRLFLATEYYVQDHFPNLEKRGPEYNRKVAELYNDMLQRTQPSYDVMQRNAFLRSDSPATKVFGMFKTQTFNMGGEVIDAWGRLTAFEKMHKDKQVSDAQLKKVRGQFGRTVGATIASQLMLTALGVLAKAVYSNMKNYRDDKGEVTPESTFMRAVYEFLTSFAGMTMLGSEAQSTFLALTGKEKWYDLEYPGLSTVNDLITNATKMTEAFGKAVESGWEPEKVDYFRKKCIEFAMSGAILGRIPADNIYKLANALYLHYQDFIEGGPRGLLKFEAGDSLFGIRDSGVTKEQYENRAVNAYETGDIEKGDEVLKHLKASKVKEIVGAEGDKDENGKTVQNSAKYNTIDELLASDRTDEKKGELFAQMYESKALDAWTAAGGSSFDFMMGIKLENTIKNAELADDELYTFVLNTKDFTPKQKVAWLLKNKSDGTGYQMWNEAGGNDWDYIKHRSDMEKFTGKGKKEKILNYVRKQTTDEKKREALFRAAGYKDYAEYKLKH